MTALSPLFWSTLALAVVLGTVTAVLILEIVRGRVSVTIPWGRRWYPLEERTIRIEAMPAVVTRALLSAARGSGPPLAEGERTTLLGEEGGLVVNESLTRSVFGLVRAVELVRFEPGRVTYRHLSGPLPGTEEEFVVEEEEGGTLVTYRGRIPISFWRLGALVARIAIIPEYNRLVAAHMDALKRGGERRRARES